MTHPKRKVFETRSAKLARLALLHFALLASLTACSSKDRDTSGHGAPGSLGAQSSGGSANLGGADDPDSLQPSGGMPLTSPARELRSEQGAGCNVKNDCENGLSCIRGVCQPPSFDLEVSGKECVQVDCQTQRDCCGNLPTDGPQKCGSRPSKCLAILPGCVSSACTRESDCAGGGACVGSCTVSTGQCTGKADCLENRCLKGQCSIDFATCERDSDCTENVCSSGYCDCENPSYDPADPICEDEECEGLCLFTCEESRCVIPTACNANADCFGSNPLCDEGKCVQCTQNSDCSFGRICLEGRCKTACSNDTECPLFEACEAGECIYVGCRSDRECTLNPSLEALGLPEGLDPRLLRCNTEDGVGRCIVPCQTDSQCPYQEVCSGGVCQYIGCESDAECKTILGVFDRQKTDQSPWVPIVECRAQDETESGRDGGKEDD